MHSARCHWSIKVSLVVAVAHIVNTRTLAVDLIQRRHAASPMTGRPKRNQIYCSGFRFHRVWVVLSRMLHALTLMRTHGTVCSRTANSMSRLHIRFPRKPHCHTNLLLVCHRTANAHIRTQSLSSCYRRCEYGISTCRARTHSHLLACTLILIILLVWHICNALWVYVCGNIDLIFPTSYESSVHCCV